MFESLDDQTYMNIKTFRKSGEGVPTPVWFYKDGNTLYVTTQKTSGKVKRIGHTPEVEIAPCEFQGDLLGDFLPAKAEVLQTDDEREHAHKLLESKYGQEDVWKRLMTTREDTTRAYLRISPR